MAATPHPEQDVRKFMGAPTAETAEVGEKRKASEEPPIKKTRKEKRKRIEEDEDGIEEILKKRIMEKALGALLSTRKVGRKDL